MTWLRKPFLQILYDLSARKVVLFLLGLAGVAPRQPRILPVSVEFLRSHEYRTIMMKHVPCSGDYGKYEASTYTRSYIYRHHDSLVRLGVFRWRGMQEHMDLVLHHVIDTTKVVVDFGGAGCPLGLGSIVVDRAKKDAMGRPVLYKSITDLHQMVDTVFSSHCLEHIEALEDTLWEIRTTMKPGGVFLGFVPSYTNEGWRAGIHRNKLFGSHVWTFGLRGSAIPQDVLRYKNIDEILEKFFQVESAMYCGDDSIFFLCRHPG